MSERISFTHDELRILQYLISEARLGWDEDAEEQEIAIADTAETKVRRAWAKAARKRP